MSACTEAPAPPADKAEAASEPGVSTGAQPANGSDGDLKVDAGKMRELQIQEISESAFAAQLSATGKVQFNEDKIARILPPVNGQVQDLNVKVGDLVKQGATLFTLKSREVAAAATEHLESHKDRDLAEKTYAMTKDLFDHQAASRMALQQAESDLLKSQARVAQTEEALRVLGVSFREGNDAAPLNSKIPVKAPLSGVVIERHVTESQFVQPDSNPLIIIADLSSVWVMADIFERDLHRVRLRQKAEVTTVAYPDDHFAARVDHIGDVLDPASRTVKVRFLVANPGARLKPEMFATVALSLDESTHGLTVPAQAVFAQGGKNFVYRNTGERTFSLQEVEVLPDGSGRLRIASGLNPGDRIVTRGVLLLHQQDDKKHG
jgi:cobalt-zinc-cadmium efflux system membrane fusion protein